MSSDSKTSFDLEPNPFERSFASKDSQPQSATDDSLGSLSNASKSSNKHNLHIPNISSLNPNPTKLPGITPPLFTPGGRRLPPLGLSPNGHLSNPGTPGSNLWNSLLSATNNHGNVDPHHPGANSSAPHTNSNLVPSAYPHSSNNPANTSHTYNQFINGLRKTGLTPNESNLRSGLTPGGLNHSFPFGSVGQVPGLTTPSALLNSPMTPGLSSLFGITSSSNSTAPSNNTNQNHLPPPATGNPPTSQLANVTNGSNPGNDILNFPPPAPPSQSTNLNLPPPPPPPPSSSTSTAHINSIPSIQPPLPHPQSHPHPHPQSQSQSQSQSSISLQSLPPPQAVAGSQSQPQNQSSLNQSPSFPPQNAPQIAPPNSHLQSRIQESSEIKSESPALGQGSRLMMGNDKPQQNVTLPSTLTENSGSSTDTQPTSTGTIPLSIKSESIHNMSKQSSPSPQLNSVAVSTTSNKRRKSSTSSEKNSKKSKLNKANKTNNSTINNANTNNITEDPSEKPTAVQNTLSSNTVDSHNSSIYSSSASPPSMIVDPSEATLNARGPKSGGIKQDKGDSKKSFEKAAGTNKRPKSSENDKRKNFLERNRVAASKCRQRKKQLLQKMEDELTFYSSGYRELSAQVSQIREQLLNVRGVLVGHKDCSALVSSVGGYEQLNNIIRQTDYVVHLTARSQTNLTSIPSTVPTTLNNPDMSNVGSMSDTMGGVHNGFHIPPQPQPHQTQPPFARDGSSNINNVSSDTIASTGSLSFSHQQPPHPQLSHPHSNSHQHQQLHSHSLPEAHQQPGIGSNHNGENPNLNSHGGGGNIVSHHSLSDLPAAAAASLTGNVAVGHQNEHQGGNMRAIHSMSNLAAMNRQQQQQMNNHASGANGDESFSLRNVNSMIDLQQRHPNNAAAPHAVSNQGFV